MRVAVIIPTTNGPAPVLKLTRLVQAPRSVMRTQDDYRPLPPSSRYHAFIQPGGPLAEQIGLGEGQCELRLGAPVETGRSWELPVALAHWVQSAGHHLDPEAAELVVWATGALDNDLSVLSQHYHLSAKLERSEQLLQSWLDRGVPVLLLLPEEIKRTDSLMGPLVTDRKVRDLSAAIAAIAAMQPKAMVTSPVIGALQPAQRRQLLVAGMAALLLSAAYWLSTGLLPTVTANQLEGNDAAILAAPGTDEEARSPPLELAEADPALDPVSAQPPVQPRRSTSGLSVPEDVATPVVAFTALVSPRIILEQAPQGAVCRSVLFGETAPQRVDLIDVEGMFHAVADGDMCGLVFYLPESASEVADIILPPALTDLILPSDRQARFSLAPGEEQLFRLRARLPARIEADVGMPRFGRDPVQFRLIIENRR